MKTNTAYTLRVLFTLKDTRQLCELEGNARLVLKLVDKLKYKRKRGVE